MMIYDKRAPRNIFRMAILRGLFAFAWLMCLLIVSAMVTPAHATCSTKILPDTNGQGGAWKYPNGVSYPIVYTPSVNATSVGLEFWMHQFNSGAPPGSLYLLWYLNDPLHNGRRMGIAWNGSPDEQGGAFKNFALSTFVHPDEQFIVVIVNNSGSDQWGYLAVTIRECLP